VVVVVSAVPGPALLHELTVLRHRGISVVTPSLLEATGRRGIA